MMEKYYIGHVAQKTGASRKAIRLYEELGLIPQPERIGTYRTYTEVHIELIQIIKQAQTLGFKLSEIKGLSSESHGCDYFPWKDAVLLTQKKVQNNLEQISKIHEQNSELKFFLKKLQKKCTDWLDPAPMGRVYIKSNIFQQE